MSLISTEFAFLCGIYFDRVLHGSKSSSFVLLSSTDIDCDQVETFEWIYLDRVLYGTRLNCWVSFKSTEIRNENFGVEIFDASKHPPLLHMEKYFLFINPSSISIGKISKDFGDFCNRYQKCKNHFSLRFSLLLSILNIIELTELVSKLRYIINIAKLEIY